VKKILKSKIEVCFDDSTTKTIEYPADDVQLVSTHPQQSVYYVALGTPDQQFAYDANPKDLQMGDLVFCLYQNGAENGARFRGRVASVSGDGQTVDIAYDDGYVSSFFLDARSL
jgi:hypothetical protein